MPLHTAEEMKNAVMTQAVWDSSTPKSLLIWGSAGMTIVCETAYASVLDASTMVTKTGWRAGRGPATRRALIAAPSVREPCVDTDLPYGIWYTTLHGGNSTGRQPGAGTKEPT